MRSFALAALVATSLANPVPQASTVDNTGCVTQPSPDDTPENFLSNAAFSSAANSAQAPTGYASVYTNKAASSQGVDGYMGLSVLDTYDVAECSKRCDGIKGCQSVNIFFEREPTVDQERCNNPPSRTVIKCVFYGGQVTESSATNDGSWRREFRVVIAGSNGYVKTRVATPAGYQAPVFLDNAAIRAPLDCNKRDTFMGSRVFQIGAFDIERCASTCSSQSTYNRKHPAKDGSFRTCQFFNTYMSYNGTTPTGQHCVLYNETWPATFATNRGQWRGFDFFGIGDSYAVSNTTGNLDQPQGCTNPTAPKK